MKCVIVVMVVSLSAGCTAPQWPEPPAVDRAQHQQQYQAWLDDQQHTARMSSILVGIWPLEEGETPFGADGSLPIVLPAKGVPSRAGVFRRAGEKVTVTPAPGVTLLSGEDKPVMASSEVPYELKLGSLRMSVSAMGDGRQFVSVSDEAHPVLQEFPRVQAYPLEPRWRVAARFDAFATPKTMDIADVRGGTMEYPAVGRLTFRIGDREQQLTAFRFPDSEDFFVLFKDATNATTTYGFRMFDAPVVGNGEWTVIDFNLARNPPCAYSPYTTCPLPPAENRLAVAIEAGEKRFPTGRGFVQQ
jgi:uncharacterized protein (DUF1684 family)